MKVNCPSCGASNNDNFICSLCYSSLNSSFDKTSTKDTSISLLNRGIDLYRSQNYWEAEVIFGKVLEKDSEDFMASLYLAFSKHKQFIDFSILMNNLQQLIQSTKNTQHLDTIYQEIISFINSYLEPEFIQNDLNDLEIDWDCLIDGLNFAPALDAQKLMTDLSTFYAFLLKLPSPYPQLFLRSLIKRYQYPWANSWWSREKILTELELIKEQELLLKHYMEEAKTLYASLSNLHIEVLKLYLETKGNNYYNFKENEIISWNTKINDLFTSIDYTEYEMGFNHQARIEPYINELARVRSV